MRQPYIMIGEIVKPQGVRGQVKVVPVTSDVYRFEGMTDAFFKKGEKYIPIKLDVARIAPDGVFLTVNDISDRDEAEKLRGEFIYVARDDAIELTEDENLIVELIGLKGIDDNGTEIGVIKDVLQPGGNDVYVFGSKKGDILVPALKSVVVKVDIDAGVMILSSKRMAEVAVYPDED